MKFKSLFLLLFWCLTNLVFGQTTLIQDTLNNVTITAQRQARPAFAVPEAVSIVSQQYLERHVSRSMAESLIGVPGVWMQKTNHGGGSPFVRGFTGNQTLLLLDGIRLNNSTYRYGPNQYFNTIDVLNVRQIEAVRGTGSVLYGSDALGGAIQVFTKTPKFSDGVWETHGRLLGRMITQDMEYGGRGELQIANDRIAIMGGFSLRDFGELIAGKNLGKQAPSAYDEIGGDFKMLVKTGKEGILTLAYNGLFQSEVGRYDQVAQRGYQTYMFDPQERQMAYTRWQTGTANPLFETITTTVSWQSSYEGRIKQREESTTVENEIDEVNTIGAVLEVASSFKPKWSAVSGLEFYRDVVNSSETRTDLSTNAVTSHRGLYPDDSKAANIAFFTSHTFDFSPLMLNIGGRFNYFDLQIEDATFGNTTLQPTALVGNLSAHYTLSTSSAITASINTGFRAPNINDMSSFGSFDFGVEVPSKELASERTLTFEVGYKLNHEWSSLQLSLFRTQLFDLIGRVPSTFNGSSTYNGEDVYTKENIAKSFIQGVEFDGSINLGSQFSLLGSLIYTYGEDTEKDEPMRRIPPLNGRLSLTYKPNPNWYADLTFWYASKQDRLSGGDTRDHRIPDGGTPEWRVLHFNVGYDFGKIQLNGGIQNLFNEAYRIHGSGVDGMGRNAWLAASLAF